MTLTIHTEEDEQRQLLLEIEVPEERVKKAMRRTARRLARDMRIPGFRKGKAPYHVIVQRIGREALRAETVDDLVPGVFEEALEQVDTELYGTPSLNDLKMDPLVLKFTLPLPPVVELGEYRELRKEIEEVAVSDEALEEALEQVRIRHQKSEPVDRPVEAGDLVAVSGRGLVLPGETEDEAGEAEDGAEAAEEDAGDEPDILFDEERIALLMDSDKLFAGTPFVENLIGLSAGDEKSFSFVFPDDFEDEELAGRKAEIEITVLDVNSRELPELDDELAKLEGDFETLDELRDSLQEELLQQAQSAAREQLIDEWVNDLREGATLVYPPSAVEEEIGEMLETFKGRVKNSGWEWEDYLKIQGEDELMLREEFRETAVKRLEQRLVLRQFILDEKLKVDAADLDAAIEARVQAFEDNEELQNSMRDFYRQGFGFDSVSSSVLMDKAYERMRAILSGNAPDPDALEAESDEAELADEDDGEEE
ncbi:MAG: trigger factor [Anaerolineae bacterium]